MKLSLRIYYGGSFDPIHDGHLAIARAARDALGVPVTLVPAGDPPHKPPTRASGEQRAHMLELAIAGEPGLAIDRRELRRAGPSYTVETLTELRAELGAEAPLAWLVGADSLRQLSSWHRWRELFTLAHLLSVPRAEATTDGGESQSLAAELAHRRCPLAALSSRPAGGLALLPLPALRSESSSALRQRIASGAPWSDWVPPAVAAYIVQQSLYIDPAAILPSSPSSACP